MTSIDTKILKQILLKGNYVTVDGLHKSEELENLHHIPFTDYLVADDLISKRLLGEAIAEYLKVPYSDLGYDQPSREQVLKIPEDFAKKHRVVLFAFHDNVLTVSTDDPQQPNLIEELQKLFPKYELALTYSLPADVEAAFVYYQKPIETRFSKIIAKSDRIAPELLDEIFSDSLIYRASDIHFEPESSGVIVRFRIDGALREAGRLPKEYYENLLNRIKIQSRLRIDEHFVPQDGSLRYEKNGLATDMRVSVIPTVEGEKIVLRVLAAYVQGYNFSHLGLSHEYQELIHEAARKPFGMILVTGPTGSGKTTTLYALLKMLNQPDVNITTIEDPVEYKVQGINQIQVNTDTNLTFARGIRSIVRQDPDIILVGEIRDEETAEVAINAALTGHLLLSTFHANDAATVIPRLLDMKVEPFLLSSTLNVIVAQRLVRSICEHCRHSVEIPRAQLGFPKPEKYFDTPTVQLFEGKKCEACNYSGFKGRTAIYEIIRVTPEIHQLILERAAAPQIWKVAQAQGSRAMFIDGIEKVKTGITTMDELLRVAEPPEY